PTLHPRNLQDAWSAGGQLIHRADGLRSENAFGDQRLSGKSTRRADGLGARLASEADEAWGPMSPRKGDFPEHRAELWSHVLRQAATKCLIIASEGGISREAST